MSEEDYYSEDVVLNTLPIKIMLAFNSQFKITDSGDVENGVEFNYSMIAKNPVLAEISGAAKFKMPYFTNNVMYPEDELTTNGPAFAVEVFFDKERFEQFLLKYASNTYVNDKHPDASDPESDVSMALNDNATFNVNCMLKILLPISTEFGNALTSSFHRYIKYDYMTNIFPASVYDVNRLFNSTKWLIEAEGKPQYVQNVIWASSILDNPHYFYFLYVYNNSLVRRRKLRGQADDDYNMRILSLLDNLRLKMQTHADKKNLFDLIQNDLTQKKTGRDPKYKSEYDDLLSTLSKEIGLESETQQTKISTIVNTFIKHPSNETPQLGPDSLLMLDPNDPKQKTYIMDKQKVVNAMKDDNKKQEIQQIIDIITRMHVAIHEYRESARKSTTGTKQFNFDSQVAQQFDAIYRDCVQVKGMALIKRFINGLDQFMDLNEKTPSEQDKTVQELDIIKFIKTANPQYREINDAISKVMRNVYLPLRESLNRALQKELLNIKLASRKIMAETQDSGDTCDVAQTKPDFLRDVYSRYFYENRGYSEFDENKLFTNVGIYTSPEGTRNFEIYVVVDTVDKEKYDEASGAGCRVKEDNVSNAFLNAISMKTKQRIGVVRDHKALNSATITQKQPQNAEQKQKGGGKRTRRMRRRTHT